MAIVSKLSSTDVVILATAYNRLDNFGYTGWSYIADHLENLSDGMGKDIELDIVGICCEYEKHDSVQDVYEDYPDIADADEWDEMDDDEKLDAVESWLDDNTGVVCCEEDLIIFASF